MLPSSDYSLSFELSLSMKVVSGDLVSDVPPGAVAAAHRRHDAVVTAMLCSTPVSGPTESVSAGGKDKAKKPARCNIIGLDVTKQFLLHIASGVTTRWLMSQVSCFCIGSLILCDPC